MQAKTRNIYLHITLVTFMLFGVVRPAIQPRQSKKFIRSSNKLSYLGSFKSTQSNDYQAPKGGKGVSEYFMSQNAAGHATAESDCRDFLGNNATLLKIETQDELETVTNELRQTDNTASSFWTSGRYDPSKKALVWGPGVAIGPWAPWEAGHPTTKLPVTRVSLTYNGEVCFRTEHNTKSFRYICELNI